MTVYSVLHDGSVLWLTVYSVLYDGSVLWLFTVSCTMEACSGCLQCLVRWKRALADCLQCLVRWKHALAVYSVLYDGSVLWLPGGVYKTSCDIDVTYYPFDSQTCSVVLSTLVSRDFEISLYASVTEATSLSLFTASGTWDLVSFTATDNNDET